MRFDDVGAVYSIQVGARGAHGLSAHALRRRRCAGPLSTRQEYVSSFLAALRAKAIESMHALLEAEADDDDA